MLHPCDSEAINDIKSLTETSELIQKIRIRRLTKAETLQIQVAETFVRELVRLGTCAIRHCH